MPSCSVPGCEAARRRRGWCMKHYRRWLRHGDPQVTRQRPPGMSKAQVVEHELSRATAEGACRLTTSWRNASGHGVVTFAGRQLLLHRLALEVRLGRELAEDEQANHACHRPACINPEHLYVGGRRRRTCSTTVGPGCRRRGS